MTLLRHWKLLLGLLAVFLAGTATGSVGMRSWIMKRFEERVNPDNWGPRTMNWLRTDLELSTEQETRVLPSVDQAVGGLVALRDNTDRERRAILSRMLTEVAQHLTPSQRDQLRTLIQDMEHRRKAGGP